MDHLPRSPLLVIHLTFLLTVTTMVFSTPSPSNDTDLAPLLAFKARLEISNNYLQGDLDFFAVLSNCRHLEFLNIQMNSFTGIISDFTGNLSTDLVMLAADSNNLSGSIPSTISNLTGLSLLSLSGNQISGMIPDSIVLLENLQVLDLAMNSMFGPIPTIIGTLRRMFALFLGHNNFFWLHSW